ncbi:hypothetical protein [Gemmata palustris]|uniref:hypothetical protein n=1 Tax=Gemmata palustris TaxID=2822762 RepID=UPI001FE5F05D|nr:hypothetical protein [Gemmata palustris]
MTEAEWRTGDNPEVLFQLLRGRTSDRKSYLFAAECFWRLSRMIPSPRQREALAVLEKWAEGTATPAERAAAAKGVRFGCYEFLSRIAIEGPASGDDPHFVGLMLYRELVRSSPAVHALSASAGVVDRLEEQVRQSELVREIFGNPFRPVAFSSEWRTSTAVALAAQMYEAREFGAMPILADALQDAGCDSADILDHCRDASAPHVRGCWVVDLVLGKE